MKKLFSLLLALVLVSSNFSVAFAGELDSGRSQHSPSNNHQEYLETLAHKMISFDEIPSNILEYKRLTAEKDKIIDKEFNSLSLADQNKVLTIIQNKNKDWSQYQLFGMVSRMKKMAENEGKSLLDANIEEWNTYGERAKKISFKAFDSWKQDCRYQYFETWLPYKDYIEGYTSATGVNYSIIGTDPSGKELLCDYSLRYIGNDFSYVGGKTWRARRALKLLPPATGVHMSIDGGFTEILVGGKVDILYGSKQDLLNEIILWK